MSALPAPASGRPPPQAWINRFARHAEAFGPGAFGTVLPAAAFPDAHWIATSADCARMLGFPDDWATRPDWDALAVFTGQAAWPGMTSWASVYSGHQFGVWAGQLGDGRALMLGELATPADGPQELQLKGAGRTPYSRMGDGRAVLRSSIREFLCSEALHALGVPTTRALALAGSSQPVRREELETAAIVTRVEPSFLRFGHFEHFAHHGQPERLRALVDFTIATYFADCLPPAEGDPADGSGPLRRWFAEVVRRTATLLAQWQAIGFCHGVMNTDNMSILGLTIDYGPFGFLDAFDPGHICNHTDAQGRYAFARQPEVAWWNLHALAHALRPLFADPDAALPPLLAPFADLFGAAFNARLQAKFGLVDAEDGDAALINDFLALLAAGRVDYTIAFRRLAACAAGAAAAPAALRDLFPDRPPFDAWAARYLARLAREPRGDAARRGEMQRTNPKYILRNHLAQQAIERAVGGDFTEVRRLHEVLRHPFDEQPAHDADAGFPPDWATHLEVSCSS